MRFFSCLLTLERIEYESRLGDECQELNVKHSVTLNHVEVFEDPKDLKSEKFLLILLNFQSILIIRVRHFSVLYA